RVRIASTHDGGGPLRRRQHENVGLAEGHGGHRRIRAAAALPHADVRRDGAGLRQSKAERAWRGRHRPGPRGAGEKGGGKTGGRNAGGGKKKVRETRERGAPPPEK